ncbi:conserved hypothetical protein [Talaromyces stipitatus ATCC 10500]|uniref:RRM domain-containing protein n=1 Tax=Talaromyces stipitatus (strain ATCC 10500 / CBS 375.48 / QM 6759 / NRRL 1006) TaxID=441959 RepID=B8MD85_TALSN|nr:uncharacterized protein TSTA_114230 [Talaromyces stipitatus ATCC 10500]EED17610.1 conserved hypothetical protein [Talaromyces stipitatus ATCC 10500]
MNSIRQIQALNKRELENAVPPEASWHADYRDTAYIYIGGLPFDLSEGDIVTIFSQYGEPVHVNLVRDKDTGKSKGFAFLKYEDQRSTDLAVDNLGGATVMGRVLRVDHTRYKRKDGEEEEDNVATIMGSTTGHRDEDTDTERRDRKSWRKGGDTDENDVEEPSRPMLKEEIELVELMRDHDDEDPMKEYLIQEKKEEVARALENLKSREKKSSSRRKDSRERSHKHRHHHHHHHHRRRRSDERSRERSHRELDDGSRRERHRRERSESPHRRQERSRERSRRERD